MFSILYCQVDIEELNRRTHSMDVIQAIFLALVQGITEFLPISSSAHLVLIPHLFDWKSSLAFDVVLHGGTLFAVVFHYRKPLALALHASSDKALVGIEGGRLLRCMVIGSLPILAAGFFLHDLVELYLRSPLMVAGMTIIFALLLWLADAIGRRQCSLSPMVALWVGLAQVLALVPGVSRAGITLTAARFLGLSRRDAADFSFLLAIPAIAAATIYEVFLIADSYERVSLDAMIAGFVVSAVFALVTIRLFLRFVEAIGLLPFVIYRIAIGGVLLFIYL